MTLTSRVRVGADDPEAAEREQTPLEDSTMRVTGDAMLRFDAPPLLQPSAARLPQPRRSCPSAAPLPLIAPPRNDAVYYRVCCHLKRHLRNSRKALIVVIAETADSELLRRGIAAYGSSQPLREAADLVLAVTRLPSGGPAEDRTARLKPLLLDIDRYDLYGNVALYSPENPREEMTELLRIARDRRGVTLVAGGEEATGSPALGSPALGSPALGAAVETLSCDLGVPVVSADSDDLVDLCGSILVDSESWVELSGESQQAAADRRWRIHGSGDSALGGRLLELRRRRGSRPNGGWLTIAGTTAAAAG